VLLHPDTARISIQHVNIHQPRKLRISDSTDETDGSETKIYAISSEGGNVIYHVSNQGRLYAGKNSDDMRTYALTSVNEGKSSTKMTQARGETELSFEKVNPNDLNLRMNPFGSRGSLDGAMFEGYEPPVSQVPKNAKRLDGETCKKEGIYFDDAEQAEEAVEVLEDEEEEKELSPEEIAMSILSDILDKVAGKEPDPIVLQGSLLESESVENLAGLENGNTRRRRIASNQSKESWQLGVDDLLDAVDSRMQEPDLGDNDADAVSVKERQRDTPVIHPLHTHILLYTQKYDAQRTLYSLNCLKAILSSSPRLVTCAMATTSIASANSPHVLQLQNLLLRHRRSVFGKNFFSEVPSDALALNRQCMFVEVVISICLYFMRSYYPNLMMSKLTDLELNGNKEVQILSCEILTLLLSELVNIAKDSGRGFSTYISDLFFRCKVQKALLHCILASVFNARHKGSSAGTPLNITEAIISFNEENMDSNTNETFQVKLLKLVLVLIILEDQIRAAKSETHDASTLAPPDWDKTKVSFQPSLSTVRYIQSRPIVYQGMLLSAILSALKQQHLTHMHRHWVTMVTSAMPYMGRALAHTLVPLVNQLCKNIELVSELYELDNFSLIGTNNPCRIPADHIITILESLTTMSQYCLLDGGQQDIALGPPVPTNPSNMVNDTATASKIIFNLIHVFNPYGNSREPTPDKDTGNSVSPVMEARRNILSILPRILASLTVLWKAVNVSEDRKDSSQKEQVCWSLGSPKVVRQYIMEFVSPISRHHGVNMLGAVAVVWNDRRQRGAAMKKVIPNACEDQLLLVDLVSAIKVLPTDTLMQTIKQVMKQPPPTTQDKHRKRTPLEVSMLQFFYAYVQRTPGQQLVDSWQSLLSLLKDGLQLALPPPGQFLLLAILNEFVQKIPTFEEKKDQKELQDIAQKLLEACSEIAGSSLEQTTWLRRNLAVKPGPQVDILEPDDGTTDQDGDISTEPQTENKPQELNYRQYSVQALMIIAELIAPLLDVIYSSEEKDKVVPFLNSIMHHVFPYLRNHSPHNLPSYRACSQMLASLSSYQYTRKTWRKEAFELLLDPGFFQMDEICLGFWKAIIDNLMTHDKTTFKDLLARVTVVPSGSLNLFSSREQEIEQRAQLLKRLSFSIYSSEIDQYQRFMPDIQERLSDSLRVPSVPSIQAQTFLCFRVLVLRMSPQHLTSLWPTMITELVHVLLQIEQELFDVEETNVYDQTITYIPESLPASGERGLQTVRNKAQLARMANMDSAWALGNGLNAHHNPSWLHLYLSACKLLDLALVLPSDLLPQFQLYRWAFTGDPGMEDLGRKKAKEQNPNFTPHVLRISHLMNKKFGANSCRLKRLPGCPLMSVQHIRSLQDLQPFFNTIAAAVQSGDNLNSASQAELGVVANLPKSVSMPEYLSASSLDLSRSPWQRNAASSGVSPRQYIEQLIENDFLEQMPRA